MTMRWRKVLGDLAQYRLQLALVVLVLAMGIAAVVAALNARAILEREIAASFASARVPDIALWVDRVEARQLATLEREQGVAGVGARRMINSRIAARDGSWLPLRLTIRAELPTAGLAATHAHRAPASNEGVALLIDQSGEALVETGQPIRLRKRDGTTLAVAFGGLLHDTSVAPSTQERMVHGFGTPALAAALDYGADLDQLLVKMEYRESTTAAVQLGNRLADVLAREGPRPARVEVLQATHPHGPLMNAMLRILGVFTAMAFVCSAALAGYLMSALMRRETVHVGVLKTLGARTHQVAAQYLALALPLAIVAVALAMPAGVALGRALAAYEMDVLNIDIASWEVPATLFWQELALAISIPLVALALPIARAARLTPRAAIQDPGITLPPLTARLAARWLAVPGRVAATMAMRNVFRRPWRLLVMALALGAGGALLLTSKTNYQSLMGAIDHSLAQDGHDAEVLLQRPGSSRELEAIAAALPEVALAEAWRRAGVTMAATEVEGQRFTLIGHPEASRLFTATVVEGRAPRSGSADEVVANRSLLQLYPGLQLGQPISIQFRERRVAMRLVGFVEQIGAPVIYAPFPAYDAVTALGDSAFAVRARARSVTPEALAAALDQAFLDARRPPSQLITRTMIRDSLDEHFQVVGGVVRMAALTAVLVGALVLAATAAFNVIDRRREIGILRTLGARPPRILGVLCVEALAIVALSVGIAIGLSLALSRALLSAAERTLLRVQVPMQFSWEGLALLCGAGLVIAAAVAIVLAFMLRKPPRESLAQS